MPVDYSKGKIYRIVSANSDLVYIGSTCQSLAKRKGQHISDYKSYVKGTRPYISSCKIIEKGNIDIILIEEYKAINKMDLHKKEREHIEKNECVNKKIPGRTHKESIAEYRANNKDKLTKYQAEYRANKKAK